jgi:hypothetical protein
MYVIDTHDVILHGENPIILFLPKHQAASDRMVHWLPKNLQSNGTLFQFLYHHTPSRYEKSSNTVDSPAIFL